MPTKIYIIKFLALFFCFVLCSTLKEMVFFLITGQTNTLFGFLAD